MKKNHVVVDQRLVDRIIATAQNSVVGLGDPEPGKSYILAHYRRPDLFALAMLLVGAHFDKYDIISVFAAALEVIAEESGANSPPPHTEPTQLVPPTGDTTPS